MYYRYIYINITVLYYGINKKHKKIKYIIFAKIKYIIFEKIKYRSRVQQ